MGSPDARLRVTFLFLGKSVTPAPQPRSMHSIADATVLIERFHSKGAVKALTSALRAGPLKETKNLSDAYLCVELIAPWEKVFLAVYFDEQRKFLHIDGRTFEVTPAVKQWLTTFVEPLIAASALDAHVDSAKK